MTTPTTATGGPTEGPGATWDTWIPEPDPTAPGAQGPAAPSPADEAGPTDPWPPAPPNPSPRWARWALGGLLATTAVLYLWGLSRNGWANSYYSAAAQAAGDSWRAWFFGSLDAANSITVDKAPASLWLMGLSVRLFGLSSWSILVPQALLGVASVGVLHATVRRWFGAPAGLIAGAVAGPHARGHADVPVQQPRRPARTPADLRRLGHGPGHRARVAALDRPGRRVRRPGVPGQDDAGVPGAARFRARCTRWPHRWTGAAGSGTCSPRSPRWSQRRGGGSRWSSCGRPTRGRTSAARRPTRWWSSSWATTGSAG